MVLACKNWNYVTFFCVCIIFIESFTGLSIISSTLSLSLYLVLTGDQGFLNSYYTGFPNAHVFEPNLPIDSRSVPEMQRLSTLYNADVGLYMLANKVLTMMYGY